ncbi:hypothetical protein EK904_014374 [Melospiza melodia maxima]|nr:hypothetical protein EK904_014374 [Melospiza melodia maxima]
MVPVLKEKLLLLQADPRLWGFIRQHNYMYIAVSTLCECLARAAASQSSCLCGSDPSWVTQGFQPSPALLILTFCPTLGTLSCSCCPGGACSDPGACSPCAPGQHQPQRGQPSCLPCPQGSYTSLPRSSVCLPCPPGHFANESGAAACRACERGYYSSKQNAAFCLPCQPGSFCNTSGCSGCRPCPGGQEAPREAAETCETCPAGTFKGANDSRCKACRTGEYQLQRGKESCELCPENHYCPSPDVKPVKCPPDAFCPRGSAEPTYCMELFLYKAGDSCQLTPATVIVLATFSAGGILVVFLIILRSRQEHGRSSLKSPLLPRGSGLGSYGGTEHTEPVYAGW